MGIIGVERVSASENRAVVYGQFSDAQRARCDGGEHILDSYAYPATKDCGADSCVVFA